MSYTLGTAAKATGKSKTSIQRYIKAGKISASVNENGSYAIDPAELHRVFPPVQGDSNREPAMKQSEIPPDTVSLAQFQEVQNERDYLRRQLDREFEERVKMASELRRLTLMITQEVHEPATEPDTVTPDPPAEVQKIGFFKRLFGF